MRGFARAVTSPTGLFAGEPQGRAPAAFESAQAGGFSTYIVAGHRYDALPSCQLHLEDHQGLLPEGHLGRGKIEFPHPHEALIVDALDHVAVDEQSLAPR